MKQMKKNSIFIIALVVFSCSMTSDTTVQQIAKTYGGLFELSEVSDINTSNGKSKYTILTVKDNEFIKSGHVSSKAFANNCALIIDKNRPYILKNGEKIVIEFIANHEAVVKKSTKFSFDNDEISKIRNPYLITDSIIKNFILSIISEDYSKSKLYIDNSSEYSTNESLNKLKKIIPEDFNDTKITGFIETSVNDSNRIYKVNAELMTETNFRKLINFNVIDSIGQYVINKYEY